MEVTQSTDPWKHVVVDNFLSNDDFKTVREITSQWYRPADVKKYSMFLPDFRWYRETIDAYHDALELTYILESYTEFWEDTYKMSLKDTYFQPEWVDIRGKYSYHPHVDSHQKKVSNVLYVSDEGTGTRLAKSGAMRNPKLIEWEPNRCLSFRREEHVTWHDYYHESDVPRQTFNLIYNDSPPTLEKERSPHWSSQQHGLTEL